MLAKVAKFEICDCTYIWFPILQCWLQQRMVGTSACGKIFSRKSNSTVTNVCLFVRWIYWGLKRRLQFLNRLVLFDIKNGIGICSWWGFWKCPWFWHLTKKWLSYSRSKTAQNFCKIFSRKSNSTVTNVCLFVRLSVRSSVIN